MAKGTINFHSLWRFLVPFVTLYTINDCVFFNVCPLYVTIYKFCLRIQWNPKNWRIGNVFQWRDPSNFAWGPWKFKWWGPRALNKNVYRKPCKASRHSVKFHTQVTLERHRFTLVKPSYQQLLQTCKNLLPNSHILTFRLEPDLEDMNHFQDGPRFCEMKTLNRKFYHQGYRSH